MIHLRAEHWSSLGDDTFWCWTAREFPASVPYGQQPVAPGDTVLHYGVLGAPPEAEAGQTVALLWEQYPEMQREVAERCGTSWHEQIERLHAAAAACTRRTVATDLLVADYSQHGIVDVLPIGVDTDLWRPAANGHERAELREQIGIPRNARVGFWGGHAHPMKGWDLVAPYAAEHPETWWIIVFKDHAGARPHTLKGHTVIGVSQSRVAELMRLSDFALFTSRLRPYAMLEWEAMSCNLPVVNIGHPAREFTPSPYPRLDVMERGWDRKTAKQTWLEYLGVM